MDMIDAAVRRVLTLKERLGLFDKPFGRGRESTGLAPPEARRALARDLARRAIVLLKNDNVLPLLPGDLREIAVIGPLADARAEMLGPWAMAGSADSAVTICKGLAAALPNTKMLLRQG